MDIVEVVLQELRAEMKALRKAVDRERERERERATIAPGELVGAWKYKRAAKALDIGLTELHAMLKVGLICSVTYGPGKHPRIPVGEIVRLTTVKPPPLAKSSGKRAKRARVKRSSASGFMTPEQLESAINEMR